MTREVTEHDELIALLADIQVNQEKLSARIASLEETSTGIQGLLAELIQALRSQRPAASIEEIARMYLRKPGQS